MAFPRSVAAVVFDMDGVLFDTETLYEKAALAAAREIGIDMTSEFFRSTIGSPWAVVRGQLLEHYGPDLAVDELSAASRRIFHALTDEQWLLKPGVVEMLDLLDELKLPRASPPDSMRATVEASSAEHALSGRSTHRGARRIRATQPHPDPFLKAAEVLALLHICAWQSRLASWRAFRGVGRHDDWYGADLLPATMKFAPLPACRADLHEVGRLVRAYYNG